MRTQIRRPCGTAFSGKCLQKTVWVDGRRLPPLCDRVTGLQAVCRGPFPAERPGSPPRTLLPLSPANRVALAQRRLGRLQAFTRPARNPEAPPINKMLIESVRARRVQNVDAIEKQQHTALPAASARLLAGPRDMPFVSPDAI